MGAVPLDEFDSAARVRHRDVNAIGQSAEGGPLQYKEIECVVNGDYSIKGRREDQEIFLPFSFVQRYFEVITNIYQNGINSHLFLLGMPLNLGRGRM